VAGLLRHASGVLTTLVMSFDTWAAQLPRIEVYGSTGSIALPDPNYFDGVVELFTADEPTWRALEPSAGLVGAGRGYGVADLALAQTAGTPHRASVEVGLHVLDVMESLLDAATTGAAVQVTTTCPRPDPIPGLVDLAAARQGGGSK
jgi:predicted dehydrogenase